MNPLMDMLMKAAGGGATQQVGQQFGLSNEQTTGALSQLVPALMAGLQRNTGQQGGVEALLGALNSGRHSQYLDQPELLGTEATTQDGNAILGHILGSKDASRAVANQASAQTGIGADILKKMLPIVATMVMAGLSKQNAAAAAPGQQGGGADFLSSMLGQNQSGGVAGAVAGMLGKFLGGR